ncbi:MAG: TIGR00159 family protein [Firmicutes bacterium]|nr:TIGR00159 family protein [Bacillota bacterium]
MPFEISFANFSFINVIDILIVGAALFWVLRLIARTRAVTLLKGLAVLALATGLSDLLGLVLVNWILEKALTAVIVALPIVFYPELRRALEQLGQGQFFSPSFFMDKGQVLELITAVVRSVEYMVEQGYGGLIVIERQTGLQEFLNTGVTLDAQVSMELITTIFQPNNLLHDGAVVIRDGRLVSAGVVLPLSDNPNISGKLGTRHRAALGISEVSDCVVVVVSEETGTISLVEGGQMVRDLTPEALNQRLRSLLRPKDQGLPSLFKPLKS